MEVPRQVDRVRLDILFVHRFHQASHSVVESCPADFIQLVIQELLEQEVPEAVGGYGSVVLPSDLLRSNQSVLFIQLVAEQADNLLDRQFLQRGDDLCREDLTLNAGQL
jgi:hypothetical protein